MQKTLGLPKKQKLKSRKDIDALFAGGKGFSVFPVRVTYLLLEGEAGAQMGVGASKRNFKKAVERNRIKRLLREAYRLQKGALLEVVEQKNKKLIVFFTYTDKILPTFAIVKEAVAKGLARLEQKLNEEPS
jgi:ribonuclease P protein component